MTRPCPTHPHIRDATDRSCWRCDEQTAATDHAAGAALVRAAIQSAPRPPAARDPKPTPRDLDDVRARADQEAQQ